MLYIIFRPVMRPVLRFLSCVYLLSRNFPLYDAGLRLPSARSKTPARGILHSDLACDRSAPSSTSPRIEPTASPLVLIVVLPVPPYNGHLDSHSGRLRLIRGRVGNYAR